MVDFGARRDGVLSHPPFRSLRSSGRRRCGRHVGNLGSAGVYWQRPDHVRSTAVDDENPRRLDRRWISHVRDRGSDNRRDLQTGSDANNLVAAQFAALSTQARPTRVGHRVRRARRSRPTIAD